MLTNAIKLAAILALISIAISTPAFVYIKDRNDRGVISATKDIAVEIRRSRLPRPSLAP